MNRKVLLRSENILSHDSDEKTDARRSRRQFAEVAGGSAAECTAVCCCCPLTALNIAIFTVYRMPAGLCRKAINRRKHHRKMQKKYLVQHFRAASEDFSYGPMGLSMDSFEAHTPAHDDADLEELIKLDEEMWDRFNQTGFLRSPSQR